MAGKQWPEDSRPVSLGYAWFSNKIRVWEARHISLHPARSEIRKISAEIRPSYAGGVPIWPPHLIWCSTASFRLDYRLWCMVIRLKVGLVAIQTKDIDTTSSASVHVMAWRRAGAKPLLEPILANIYNKVFALYTIGIQCIKAYACQLYFALYNLTTGVRFLSVWDIKMKYLTVVTLVFTTFEL